MTSQERDQVHRANEVISILKKIEFSLTFLVVLMTVLTVTVFFVAAVILK